MNWLERDQIVLRLAILTEDRTNQEQKALLSFAERLDKDLNRNTVTNKAMWGPNAGSKDAERQRPLSNLIAEVEATRGPH